MLQPCDPGELMLLEGNLRPKRCGQFGWWSAVQSKRSSALLVVKRVHVRLDHQSLALGRLGLGPWLARIKFALCHIGPRVADGVEGLGGPLDGHGLGAAGEVEGFALLVLRLVDLVAKRGHQIFVEHDRDRFIAAFWRVAEAEIDVLREPA